MSATLSERDFDRLIAQSVAEERKRGAANLARVDRTRWCECGDEVSADASSYYHDPLTHRHGWFHDPELDGCGGITQTG